MLKNVFNAKSPDSLLRERGFCKIGRRPTLPPVTAVPSALAGLTSLFGMGRGGHRRYRHLNIVNVLTSLPGTDVLLVAEALNNDMYWKKKRRGRQQFYL